MSSYMTSLKINRAVGDKLLGRLNSRDNIPHVGKGNSIRVTLLVIGSAMLHNAVVSAIDSEHSTAQFVASIEAARAEIERGESLPDIVVVESNDNAAIEMISGYGLDEVIRFVHAEPERPETVRMVQRAVMELIPVMG